MPTWRCETRMSRATRDHSRFQRPRPRPQQTTQLPMTASHQHHRRRVPQLTTPASHQHHRRPRLATNTTDLVPQPTTPASHQHHRHHTTSDDPGWPLVPLTPSHPKGNSQWEWFNCSMQSAAYPAFGAETQVALSVRCTEKTCRPPLLLLSTLTSSLHLRGQTSVTRVRQ